MHKEEIAVLMPVFNDWAALEKLLKIIDSTRLAEKNNLHILVVDDYSTLPIPKPLIHQAYSHIQSVQVLKLRCNLGHQRAIAVGLSYLYHHLTYDWVVVMDGDGEDNPHYIEPLIQAAQDENGKKVVFARRSKRSETYSFRFFYFLYKKLFCVLTGREISVGNFSIIPAPLLKDIVVISEIWNHYSSGIFRSRMLYLEIDTPRAKRLDGKSKMNLVSLVTHGLSSIAVYGDVVGTRILIAIVFLLFFVIGILSVVVFIRIFTELAIPGWATYVAGLLILSLMQLVLVGVVFSMMILATRNTVNLIPERDYKYYVDHCFSLMSHS
jgi:polyisoprenyl-phosphate glycosyltransferase